jgi:ribosomal protein S12 methylthiotransferase
MQKADREKRGETVGRKRNAAVNSPAREQTGGACGSSPSPTPEGGGAPIPGASEPPVVALVSLGCVKNLVDSEVMLARIAEAGAIISADESLADTIVVNTCGFLQAAREEVLEVLKELAQRKRRGELRRIVVVGCLVQRDGEKLLAAVPEIDALVGVHNRDDVARAVLGPHGPARTIPTPDRREPAGRAADFGPRGHAQRAAGFSPRGATEPAVPPRSVDLYLGSYHPQPWSDQGRLRLTPRHYAYVRVSEGCDQKCTFCTIPAIRGPMHCKLPEQLVAECRELIADGARELILIGQDTTSYGDSLGYEPGLAGLLRTLDAECDGARWLRLMYAYPSVFTDAMIDAIAECERVVKYIDLPLQHINDRVLRAMHRRVTRKQTEALLERIRRGIPGVTIRTTFLVGFPGETEAEFQELLDFVRGFGFDAAGAFKFSAEPDTPAGRMKDQLDEALKQERYERLMLTQQEIAFAAAKRRIGQSFEVVIDGPLEARCEDAPAPADRKYRPAEGRVLVARHAGQAPDVDAVCVLRDDRPLGRAVIRARAASDRSADAPRLRSGFGPSRQPVSGQFVTVRCIGTDGYDLLVEPVAARRRRR